MRAVEVKVSAMWVGAAVEAAAAATAAAAEAAEAEAEAAAAAAAAAMEPAAAPQSGEASRHTAHATPVFKSKETFAPVCNRQVRKSSLDLKMLLNAKRGQ